jgi:predicted hotdog family 3-hydroxylacyl-ACP dehydratase
VPLTIDRAWIERHIPHQGRMCLIDEVVEWNAQRILCSIGGHRSPDHPLRAYGRLGIACGIELAAQTMAVHGAILAQGSEGRPRAGLLASVRGIRLWALRLDDVESNLFCEAVHVMGNQATSLYEFELRSASSRLISGRAAVVLDVGRLAAGAVPP